MALQSSDNNGINGGQQQPNTQAGEFNNISFVIQQSLAKLQTATLVKVIKCTNSGGLSPVGFVDVQPLVNQIDLAGTPNPHVTIYNVPYFRLQGGSDAVVIDPKVGDIGMAAFASRDITKVKNTRKQANPGSFRQFSMADGLYMGGFLNGAPTQYVQFSDAGIRIHSPTLVKLDAPDVQLTAPTIELTASSALTITSPTTTVNGNLNVTGNATIGGIGFAAHKHTGVQTGGGSTGGPTN